ncbi:MAG: hypothetical protein ACFCU5_04430 [Pleurocapsa sp.]
MVVLRQKFGLMPEMMVLAIAGLTLSSCSDANAKYSQCEQIFKIAHQVNQEAKSIKSMNAEAKDIPQNLKNWLEAADLMEQAARQIQALEFNNAELIKYQTGLANIYQIYSQATYDAVQARESKNINALISARDRASTAEAIQQKLVRDINSYCLSG